MRLLFILLAFILLTSCKERIISEKIKENPNKISQNMKLNEEEISDLIYSVEENETLSYSSKKTLSKLSKLSEQEIIDLYIKIREEGKRHEITWRQEFISLTKIDEGKLPARQMLDLAWFLTEVKKDDDKDSCVAALVDFLHSEEVSESLEELEKKIKISGELYLLKAIEQYKKELKEEGS